MAWKQPFIQRVRNSSPVERAGMDNERALSAPPKPWDDEVIGRGAFRAPGSPVVRWGGARGKANVGMSNDNGGAKPPRRKTKVS